MANDLIENDPFVPHLPVVDLVTRREDGLGPEGQNVSDDLTMDIVIGPGVAIDDNIIGWFGCRLRGSGDGKKKSAK